MHLTLFLYHGFSKLVPPTPPVTIEGYKYIRKENRIEPVPLKTRTDNGKDS